MYAKHIKKYVIQGHESTGVAYWRLASTPNKTVFVLDENERLAGFLNMSSHFPPYSEQLKDATALDSCRKDVLFVFDNDNVFMQARNIFAQYPTISTLPVVDTQMNVVDVIFRFQCFYRDYYWTFLRSHTTRDFFPYPHYADCIWKAATLAQKTGYDHISVIEFGVAGGSGLVACEYHAKEIEKLFGITITLYGFDTGAGLPASHGSKDMPNHFAMGNYAMDLALLQERLRYAALILGDIKDTAGQFMRGKLAHPAPPTPPAPIGAMLIDVDYYSSTKHILEMLDYDDEYFLPLVHMYFDDIYIDHAFQGEALAVQEFNRTHDSVKISPEFLNFSQRHWGMARLKLCTRFTHRHYTTGISAPSDNPQLPLTL